jgi:hypothetical protein
MVSSGSMGVLQKTWIGMGAACVLLAACGGRTPVHGKGAGAAGTTAADAGPGSDAAVDAALLAADVREDTRDVARDGESADTSPAAIRVKSIAAGSDTRASC